MIGNEITVKELLERVEKKEIIPYDRNRGGLALNQNTLNSVAENFLPEALGMLTVMEEVHGAHVQLDFHTRLAGLIKRKELGLLTPSDESVQIRVNVIPRSKALEVYTKLNTMSGHNSSMKLNNRDLPFGKLLHEILSNLDAKDRKLINKSKMPQLGNVCYCYNNKSVKEFDYESVFSSRQIVAKLLNEVDSSHLDHLDSQSKQDVAEAVAYYVEFIKEFSALNPAKDDTYKNIVKSTPFFGFILTDYLSGEELTEVPAKKLAENVNKKKGDIHNHIVGMTHGGKSAINKNIACLYDIIRKRRAGGRPRNS